MPLEQCNVLHFFRDLDYSCRILIDMKSARGCDVFKLTLLYQDSICEMKEPVLTRYNSIDGLNIESLQF